MSLNIMDLSLFRFRAEQHTIEPEHTIILSLLNTLNLPVTSTIKDALTAARDFIADYVQPDARRVLAMIDDALAVPATVPGMETRLERWGLPVVDGPGKECSCARTPEGYWTPWHEAQGVVDRHQERIDRLTTALAEAEEKERGTFMTATLYKNECSRLDTEATAREIAAREEEREHIAELVDHLLAPNEESVRVVAAIRSQS